MGKSANLKNLVGRRVAISGVAENAKAGAVVLTERSEVIYLRDMQEWPDEFAGKRIVIDGVLRRGHVYPDVDPQDEAVSQGLPGEQWFLEVESYRLEK